MSKNKKQQKHCFEAAWNFCSSVLNMKTTEKANIFLQSVVAAR